MAVRGHGRGRSGGQAVEVVVVAGHRTGHPVTGREQQVERRRGDAQDGFDPAAPCQLGG